MRRLLVIGARPGSLGEAIVNEAKVAERTYRVTTAGLNDEDLSMNINSVMALEIIDAGHYTDVICTAGINKESVPTGLHFGHSVIDQMFTNALSPILLAEAWFAGWEYNFGRAEDTGQGIGEQLEYPLNFVAISSNSAHIARSNGVGYCASKAALSMGIRSLGRTIAGDQRFSVYCYEPAWIPETPMSTEVETRLYTASNLVELHRVPGGRLMTREALAHRIVNDLQASHTLNGTAIRMDAEQ